MRRMPKYSPYVSELAAKMSERHNHLQSTSVEVAPFGNGFHIVIPTAGGERLPITLAALKYIEEERRNTKIGIDITIADWGLNDIDARTLAQVTEALHN